MGRNSIRLSDRTAKVVLAALETQENVLGDADEVPDDMTDVATANVQHARNAIEAQTGVREGNLLE